MKEDVLHRLMFLHRHRLRMELKIMQKIYHQQLMVYQNRILLQCQVLVECQPSHPELRFLVGVIFIMIVILLVYIKLQIALLCFVCHSFNLFVYSYFNS